MKFDFTPDPKVLIALTHTPMQPLDALCELIDNAIDSFYGAKIQGLKTDNPMVIVTLPSRKQLSENGGMLRIQDNGPGMSPQNAEKAIKAGFSLGIIHTIHLACSVWALIFPLVNLEISRHF